MSRIYKTDGIVIKSMKYGESSLILDMYTLEKGLRTFIVNGIRGKHSKAAIYQMMNQLSIVAYDSGADKINRIKEAKLGVIYNGLGRDMVKSSIGVYIMDLFKQSVKEHEANQELYNFLRNTLNHIDHTNDSLGMYPILFTLAFTEQLGFYPQNNYSPQTPQFSLLDGAFISDSEAREYTLPTDLSHSLSTVLTHLENGQAIQIPGRTLRNELLKQLVNFYKIQLDGFGELRSLEVIQSLFD